MTLLLKTLPMAAAAASMLAAVAALAEEPAKTDQAQGKSCFYARNISSWANQDDETVNLRVGVRDYYQLKLLGPCPNINWNQSIGVEHRGSSWICDKLDATIIAPGPSGPRRCPAISVHKLTPEEVAALPRNAKP
jgi:hypothetical protein